MTLYDPTIWDGENEKLLLTAIQAAQTRAQAKAILGDLLTEKEVSELSKRLAIAKYLNEGLSYKEIENKTGASAATIADVSKWLNQGGGGYTLIFNLLD